MYWTSSYTFNWVFIFALTPKFIHINILNSKLTPCPCDIQILFLQTPDLKVDKIECWYDPQIFSHTNCRIEFVDRYTQLVSSTCFIMEPQYLTRMHITTFYKFRVYRKFMMEFDVNLCDVSDNGKPVAHPMLAIAVPIFRKFSTFDLKCPFKGNLTVDRVQLDGHFLPKMVIPSGQYRIDMRMYHPKTNQTQVDCKIYFTVPESRNAHIDRTMG